MSVITQSPCPVARDLSLHGSVTTDQLWWWKCSKWYFGTVTKHCGQSEWSGHCV